MCIREVLSRGWVLGADQDWRLDDTSFASSTWLGPKYPIEAVTEPRHALGNGKERLWKGPTAI